MPPSDNPEFPSTARLSTDAQQAANYHHGNLREALLTAAVDIIRETSVEKLSLRGLARKVGVSQTAPYRHFEDKNQLLVELAKDTLAEMSQAISAQLDTRKSVGEQVTHCGEAYLRYALANQERYKLAFGPSIEHRDSYTDLQEAGICCFGLLLNLIEQGITEGVFLDQDPKLMANTIWGSIHGFASLCIDGFYQRQEPKVPIEVLLDSHLKLSLRAIVINHLEKQR